MATPEDRMNALYGELCDLFERRLSAGEIEGIEAAAAFGSATGYVIAVATHGDGALADRLLGVIQNRISDTINSKRH